MIHVKKVKPEYFDALQSGDKLCELRRPDPEEPAFAVGDFLALNEWKDDRYTGRCLLFRILYVLDAAHSCGCLTEGSVALGLRLLPLNPEDLHLGALQLMPNK